MAFGPLRADLADILEIAVQLIVAIVAILATRKRRPAQQQQPEPEPEPLPYEPEPEPLPEPVEPEPVAVEAPAPTAGRDALTAALARWKKAAMPVLGEVRTRAVVEAAIAGVDGGMHQRPWPADSDAQAAELAATVARAADRLSGAAGGMPRLCAEALSDLLRPILGATSAGFGANLRDVLPQVGDTDSQVADLALEAGLFATAVPRSTRDPAAALWTLEQGLSQVLLADEETLQALLEHLRDQMLSELQAGSILGQVLLDIFRAEEGPTLLLESFVALTVAEHTGPLMLRVEQRSRRRSKGARGALRMAIARRVVEGPPASRDEDEDEEAVDPWPLVVEALAVSLRAVAVGPAESGPSLHRLSDPWSTAETGLASAVTAALSSERAPLPRRRPSARAALAVFAGLLDQTPDPVADERRLALVLDAMRGRYPRRMRERERGATAASAASRPAEVTAADALVMQVLLGRPKARRHPLLGPGPVPMWGRR